MCLIIFAYRSHPGYRLILAANRDEFYARPTAPMHFWEDDPNILAGRDLQKGGTWFGVTRTGKFAAVTNFREGVPYDPGALSRGTLVSGYLAGTHPPGIYAEGLLGRRADFSGFNLLVGDGRALWYASNVTGEARPLPAGLYGLSNGGLDEPWPKVLRGKALMAELLERGNVSSTGIMQLLADRRQPEDAELPATGVGADWERTLSPIRIESGDYGTRSSTFLAIDLCGHLSVVERQREGTQRRFGFLIDVPD